MVLDYRFWHFLMNPSSLTYALEQQEQSAKLRGYKKCLTLIFLATLAVFAIRNIWGMHTEGLTTLFAQGLDDRYIFARLISLSGALLWAIGFFAFHYIVFSYVLHAITDIPVKWIAKVQLYTIFFILLEKLITFAVFAIAGFTTPLTFFSLAPMTAYFYQEEFVLFFLNQLSVATFIMVVIQYKFLSQWYEGNKKSLLVKLIVIQIVLALIIAGISMLPVYGWIQGGLSYV